MTAADPQPDRSDPLDAVAFLARAPNRAAVLDALRRDGPLDRRALRDRFDAARTTLGRNLDALADRGWVRDDGDEYAVTPAGAAVADDFAALRDTAEAADRLQPVLARLSADAFPAALDAFADATVVTADGGDPYAPVNRHVVALRSAEQVRCLLPVVGLNALDATCERVRASDAEHEAVVEPAVADVLRSDPAYAPGVEELAAFDRVAVHVCDDAIPFYLGVLDDLVQVGVSDGDGVPQALMETRDDAARAWAAETYRSYRDRADRLF
jgi:predicted transcriptional regulator